MLTRSQVKEIEKIRQTLHKYPELSGDEPETASLIKSFLERFGADEIIERVGGYGLIGIYNGTGSSDDGEHLMLRAELDALAINERSGVPYESQNGGKMHACGHDGHMAVLLGVAKWLNHNRPRRGRVYLVFQPAEESGEGADAMMSDPAFQELRIDRAIALHNLPGYKKNVVFIRNGTFASASVGLKVSFRGQSSHAAFPREGVNPSESIAKLVQGLEKIKSRLLEKIHFRVLTITYIKVGEPAFGINPGNGELGVTIRAETDKGMEEIYKEVTALIESIATAFEGEVSTEQKEPFAATVNDEDGVDEVLKIAGSAGYDVQKLDDPFAWSEDFGEFRKGFPITLFGLGAGENTLPLHSEEYDFEDELIPAGTALFCERIKLMKGYE